MTPGKVAHSGISSKRNDHGRLWRTLDLSVLKNILFYANFLILAK